MCGYFFSEIDEIGISFGRINTSGNGKTVNDQNFFALHPNGRFEVAEPGLQLCVSGPAFNHIPFGKVNTDAIGVCISVIDVDGSLTLGDVRNVEFFPKDICRNEKAIAGFFSVLVAAYCILNRNGRIGFLVFVYPQL